MNEMKAIKIFHLFVKQRETKKELLSRGEGSSGQEQDPYPQPLSAVTLITSGLPQPSLAGGLG